MKIYVTEDDIHGGEPCDPHWCPIALAFRRQGYGGVEVNSRQVRFPRLLGGRRRNLPPEARLFVALFDETLNDPGSKAAIQPFHFEINDLPQST